LFTLEEIEFVFGVKAKFIIGELADRV